MRGLNSMWRFVGYSQGYRNRYNLIDYNDSCNFGGNKQRSFIWAHLKDFYQFTKPLQKFELLPDAVKCYLLFDEGPFFKKHKSCCFLSTINNIIPFSKALLFTSRCFLFKKSSILFSVDRFLFEKAFFKSFQKLKSKQ